MRSPDFRGALTHDRRQHAVQADRRQHPATAAKMPISTTANRRRRDRFLHERRHRLHFASGSFGSISA
jgi:hypothetical protein